MKTVFGAGLIFFLSTSVSAAELSCASDPTNPIFEIPVVVSGGTARYKGATFRVVSLRNRTNRYTHYAYTDLRLTDGEIDWSLMCLSL